MSKTKISKNSEQPLKRVFEIQILDLVETHSCSSVYRYFVTVELK